MRGNGPGRQRQNLKVNLVKSPCRHGTHPKPSGCPTVSFTDCPHRGRVGSDRKLYGFIGRGKGPFYSSLFKFLSSIVHGGDLHTKNISYVEILLNKKVKMAINQAGSLNGGNLRAPCLTSKTINMFTVEVS